MPSEIVNGPISVYLDLMGSAEKHFTGFRSRWDRLLGEKRLDYLLDVEP